MSHSTDRDQAPDAGFSLVEVLVAVGILMLLVVASLPQLLVGLRSNDVARQALQEKGFAQVEVERMRNLPFHVAPAAGDFIDVLDRFYPGLTPPDVPASCPTEGPFAAPPASWTGFVAADDSRCPWEPDGPFFRTVKTASDDERLDGFVLVLDTQFLDDSTPPSPVDPPSDYDALEVGRDAPPSTQIGVTVSVFRTTREVSRPMTTYAQIGRRDQLEALVRSSVTVSALDLGSTTGEGLPITVAGGLLRLDASLTYASRATAVASSTTTGISTGQQGGGAGASLTSPPGTTLAAADAAAGSLDASGCALVCWGATRHSAMSVSSVDGLPSVGDPTAPVRVSVRDTSNGAVTLGGGAGASYRSDLRLTGPLVRFDTGNGIDEETGSGVRTGVATGCTASSDGDPVRLVSSGWLRTTAAQDSVAPSVVEACGVSRAATVSLLPTAFAPQGVVRVNLPAASVRCQVAGAAHTPSTAVAYRAKVQVWSPNGYTTTAVVDQTTTVDPLAAYDLTTALGGGNGRLGDYVASWSALTSADVETTAVTGEASADVPGVVRILTTPTRERAVGVPDELSAVSLSLGVLACSAQDRR